MSYRAGIAVDAGLHFTAALTTITAVVGVSARRALFFLAHIAAIRADTGAPWLA